MEWMLLPLRRYADFSGRSRRLEYWMFQLLLVIVYAILGAMMLSGFPWELVNNPELAQNQAAALAGVGPMFWVGIVLMCLFGLAVIIPSIAVTVRRLHDRNISGWWYLGVIVLSLVPLVNLVAAIGGLVMFVITLLPGTDGPNRYGPDPKDPHDVEAFA